VRDLGDILRQQQTAGFPAFSGTHVAAVIPVSAAFLNQLAAQALPSGAPVSDIDIDPQPDNALRIRFRIARAPVLPPLAITLRIERQPQFPDSPVLVLRLASSALTILATAASHFFQVLPPGLRFDHNLLLVDIGELLRLRGAAQWLQYVRSIEVTTAPGTVLLSVRASVGAP
jgi:hypothetical protein